MDKYFSKQHLESVKSNIREEMKKATEKENYLNQEDAELIYKFLKKLEKEIFIQNQK